MSDWLYKTENEFYTQVKIHLSFYLKNKEALEISHKDMMDYVAAWTNYSEAFQQSALEKGNCKEKKVLKDTTKALMIKQERYMYNKYIRKVSTVSDEDLVDHLFPAQERKQSVPILLNDIAPLLQIDNSRHRIHKIFFGQNHPTIKDRMLKKKPIGISGCYIAYKIGGEKPDDIEDLNGIISCKTSPHVFTYTFGQVGLQVWYAACWYDERGRVGEWSEIIGRIIM
ncbi:MAG: hypothetical protein LBR28_05975 [Bacteroidales bacterium]|jgi:hypothetical protein|nr:hypothetical protein [Bacteroidales bacterium]